MTISIVGAVQTARGTPATHGAISGIAVGDLYIEFAHNAGGGSVPVLDTTSPFTTLVTGADMVGRNFTYGYRERDGTEGTLATTSGAGLGLVDIFFALTGVDPTTPIESLVSANSTGVSPSIAASTPTADNCWHVVVFANTNSGDLLTTPPAGYTLLGSRVINGQGNIYAYYKDLGPGSSGVSTGAVSATYAASIGGRATGFIVRASGVAPTPPNWTISSPTVDSDAGTVTCVVTLDAPAPVGGVDGLVSTYDITAVAGVDYVAQVAEPFSIAEGDTTGDIVITLIA